MRLHTLYGSLKVNRLMGVVSFFVRPQSPFLRPGQLLLRRRRAQWMSRLAVAPTLPNTLTLPGHALTSTSTVAGSMRWGDSAAGLASADGTVLIEISIGGLLVRMSDPEP